MRQVLAIILTAVLVAATSAVAEGGHPLGLNENHPYGIISNAYETPHVAWARPLAKGDIKALVLAPMWSQRETVELAQRLSLDYTAWMSANFRVMTAPAASDPAFAFFQPPPAVVHRHLRQCAAANYDVIIVGKLDWAMLPGEQRLQLLEKVAAGTGLVYVGPPADNQELKIVFGGKAAPEGRTSIASAVPLAALPAFANQSPEEIISTSLFGQGRVVVLSYGDVIPEKSTEGWPCLTPPWASPGGVYNSGQSYSDEYHKPTGYVAPDDCPEMEFVPYEYYQSLVARAVVWAAARELPARLSKVALPPTVAYPTTAHEAQVTVTAPPPGGLLKATVRSRHDTERSYPMLSRPAGAETRLALPALPAGDYFLDVWLAEAEGQVCDWSSLNFAVRADVEIRQLTLARQSYNHGDEIGGRVQLSRPLAAGETLRVELWDNYQRKMEEKLLAATGEAADFSLRVTRPLTIMHSVRAHVVRDDSEVCTRRLNFPVRANRKRAGGFNEVIWSAAGNLLITHHMLRKLSQHDQADAIDVGFSGATHARNIAAADLAALPYTTGFGHFATPIVPVLTGDRAKHGCMTNPVTHEGLDAWFTMQGDIYGPYGPLAWSHGDESYYAASPDTCWSDTCLAAFRDYLREAYPDLAALNAEWGTRYSDWAEARPLTYEEARATGNYAPWLMHRLSAGRVWARHYGRTGEVLAKNDPGARAGFDGPQGLQGPNTGINWWVLKDHLGIMQDYIYNSESMEIIRSFAGPQHLTGIWYGTYGLTWDLGPNTVPAHHYFPWYCLFHNLNSTWMWTMGVPGPLSGYAPDLTSLPFFAASRQSLKEIRSGIFELLRTGRRANDGIAIHYSEASRLADSLFADDKRARAWNEALTNFNHALEDCGLQYEYVAYEEIERDELRRGNYRVLIMPHSRAVSPQEASAIRRFVQDGGLLIADIMPGVLNGHGAKQEPGLLADIFPSSEHATVNTVGRGKTVLLGDTLAGYGAASYRHRGGWKKLEGRWQRLEHLLTGPGGIRPPVRVKPRGPEEMPPTEITRFTAGGAEFVGLLRKHSYHDSAPYAATISFPGKSHVFDVRAGKYLGFVDQLNTDISYQAQLYARLPYRVQSLALGGSPAALRIAVKTTGGRPGPGHVFEVRVLALDRRELPWYAQQVAAVDGSATVEVPWALNDAGKYTVVVRDVASGVTARREVTVP